MSDTQPPAGKRGVVAAGLADGYCVDPYEKVSQIVAAPGRMPMTFPLTPRWSGSCSHMAQQCETNPTRLEGDRPC